MKYADLMDARDRADLAKADSRIAEGRALKRRVQGRLRARAYRRTKVVQENGAGIIPAKARNISG